MRLKRGGKHNRCEKLSKHPNRKSIGSSPLSSTSCGQHEYAEKSLAAAHTSHRRSKLSTQSRPCTLAQLNEFLILSPASSSLRMDLLSSPSSASSAQRRESAS